MGPETMNDCAGEDQQQIIVLLPDGIAVEW
jgi:hypothetical protein